MASHNIQPKWFEFFLVRDSETVPYTLSEEELATVLYKDFRFGEFDVIKVDLSSMKSVKIKVKPQVDLEKHKNSAAFMVRPGLYVQAMKEVKQEKMVRLSWLSDDVTDAQIIEVLELFGKVTKQPTDAKFVIKDNATNLTKRLRNVYSNDKNVEMLIERNIPSYIKIADKKIKVWYRGQIFSCARCFKSVRDCPGKAVAKVCQVKNPSLKIDFNDHWEVIKNEAPFKAMITNEEAFETETLKLYSFPKEASRRDIFEWVREQGVTIDEEKIVPTSTSTSWFLVHVGIDNMMHTIKLLDGKTHGKDKEMRYIHCQPVQINSPEKRKLGIRPPQNSSFDKNHSATAENHEVPSSQDLKDAGTSKEAGAGVGGKQGVGSSLVRSENKNKTNSSDLKTNSSESKTDPKSDTKKSGSGIVSSIFSVFNNVWGPAEPVQSVENVDGAIEPEKSKNPGDDVSYMSQDIDTSTDLSKASTTKPPSSTNVSTPLSSKSKSKSRSESSTPSRLSLSKNKKQQKNLQKNQKNLQKTINNGAVTIIPLNTRENDDDKENDDGMTTDDDGDTNEDYMESSSTGISFASAGSVNLMSTGKKLMTPKPSFNQLDDLEITAANVVSELARAQEQSRNPVLAGQSILEPTYIPNRSDLNKAHEHIVKNVQDDWEREELLDLIDQGHQHLDKHEKSQKLMTSPAAYEQVSQKRKEKVKENWFDNTDTENEAEQPANNKNIHHEALKSVEKVVDAAHKKTLNNVSTLINLVSTIDRTRQRASLSATDITLTDSMPAGRPKSATPRLNVSEKVKIFDKTVKTTPTRITRRVKNKVVSVSDSEASGRRMIQQKLPFKKPLPPLPPKKKAPEKRGNTSPLEKPITKVIDRRATPNTTPLSATMLDDESPMSDDDDFVKDSWEQVPVRTRHKKNF